jgi:hypothetical protein
VTKATRSPALQEVRRGAAPNELEVIDQAGTVVILHAHGMHTESSSARVSGHCGYSWPPPSTPS